MEWMVAVNAALFHVLQGSLVRADDILDAAMARDPIAPLIPMPAAIAVVDRTQALRCLLKGDVETARTLVSGTDDAFMLVPLDLSRRANALVARASRELTKSEGYVIEELAFVSRSGAVLFAPDALELLACLRSDIGAHEDVVRLVGGAVSGRERLGTVRVWERFFDADEAIAKAHDALGRQAFEAAYNEGASMSIEDAVAYALRGRGSRQRPASGWESLTPAEHQVVDLVAEGLTNKQVAERLIMSPRTVSTHLSHVFAKLGVSSRSELTAEATKRKASA
jgi:DNA-binding CsgD family transcriptional regulator